MAVDVVIPLCNGGPFIEEALDSVFGQGAELGEVVVVEDGSTDDGPERVRRYGDRVRLVSNPPGDRPRFTGLRATSQPLVAFFDQDDVWHPDHLQRLTLILERHPGHALVAGRTVSFGDGTVPRLGGGHDRVLPLDPWASFPERCPIRTPSCALMRRAFLDGVDPHPSDLAGTGDLVLYLELSCQGPFLGVDARTTGNRQHAASQANRLSRDDLAYLELQLRANRHPLDHRLAREGETPDTRRLTHRLVGAEALVEVLRRNEAGDAPGAESAARRAEEALLQSGNEDLSGLYSFLARSRRAESPRAQRRDRSEFFLRLYASLPPDAELLRSELVRYAAGKRWPFRALAADVVRLRGDRLGYLTRLLGARLRPRPRRPDAAS